MRDRAKAAALATNAAQGDREAFAALVDQYRQTMYATAMAVTRNEDDALDAIQDAILTLWQKLPTLRNPLAFQTWMTRILVNRCRDLLRGRSRELPEEELPETGSEPDLDSSLDVRSTLNDLPPGDRLVLQLYYFEDLSVKEIAAALELEPAAVRARLSRGRKRFREKYEGRHRDEE